MRTGASRSGTCLMATMIFMLYPCSIAWLDADVANRIHSPAIPAQPTAQCPSSSGAPSPWAASASRNMVLQKGQAAATRLGAGGSQFRCAHVTHAFACLLAQKGQPAAGSAAEAALAERGASTNSPASADHLARLVVNAAIAAQIAGIVEDNFFAGLGLLGSWSAITRQKFAVMLHRRAACRTPSSPPEWCARNADKST